MKIQEYIEQAMQDIMQARSYITTNSVPVVRYRDRFTVKGDAWVSCHASPVDRLSPTHDLYRAPFELMTVSKSQADLKGASFDDILADCEDEVNQDLTKATLQAAIDAINPSTGITIDGIVPVEGAEVDGDYQIQTTAVDIFLTYQPPSS